MKFCFPIKLSISQTPEGEDSRTYASLDQSKRDAKDILYENLIPAHELLHQQITYQKLFRVNLINLI